MIYEWSSEDLSDVLPLLSGPKVIFIVAMEEEENGGSKAQAGGDHRQPEVAENPAIDC